MVKSIMKYLDNENGEHLSRQEAELANKSIDLTKALASNTALNHREARIAADWLVRNFILMRKSEHGSTKAHAKLATEKIPVNKEFLDEKIPVNKEYVLPESVLVQHGER